MILKPHRVAWRNNSTRLVCVKQSRCIIQPAGYLEIYRLSLLRSLVKLPACGHKINVKKAEEAMNGRSRAGRLLPLVQTQTNTHDCCRIDRSSGGWKRENSEAQTISFLCQNKILPKNNLDQHIIVRLSCSGNRVRTVSRHVFGYYTRALCFVKVQTIICPEQQISKSTN